jgi:hypothetical protein
MEVLKRLNRHLPQNIRNHLLHTSRMLQNRINPLITAGFPLEIDIETNNICNRSCGYCPREETDEAMSEELWKKIIDDLKVWGYPGRISPHGYNEPLTDPRILSFLAYANKQVPTASLVLYTNGDFLDEKMLEALLTVGVDHLEVSLHDPLSEEQVKKLEEYAQAYDQVHLKDMRSEYRLFPLTSRAGTVQIGTISPMPRCYMIERAMSIRVNGNITLCCEDYTQSFVTGNVKITSVQDLWDNEPFRTIREEIKNIHCLRVRHVAFKGTIRYP